jgi:tRNA threonylcarbamoyladenosine biosynthesis protein TsaE
MEFQIRRDEVENFARQFWTIVGVHKVFAFFGDMGAGKTTLIEALCRAKGVTDSMGSPTFSIINQYAFFEESRESVIYHIDLYRLRDEQEIVQAGVEDCIYSGDLCFVEWPQKAPDLFDENTVKVEIEAIGEQERRVKITLP